MISVASLTDHTSLIGNGQAIRDLWNDEGVLFYREILDPELIRWAREQYRKVLAAEGLIDPAVEAPIWTGVAPRTFRPCDALGTTVWHEIVKQPALNACLREIFECEPAWIPIAAHRSSMPTGPVEEGQDIFAGRHQDRFFNEGMNFTVCWIPLRDVDMNSGSFAVAPGTHKRGILHCRSEDGHGIPTGAIAPDEWRAADYRVGDVLIFNYEVAHATLPNPSSEIRMSLDVRAVPASAPQPVIGEVDSVEGADVTIRTEDGERATLRVTDETLIRDMNPTPGDLTSALHPGLRVMAMADADGKATVLRRNFY